jgi:L-alanine-DL-glutamate epimerase-like enolase superfamily enzyme
MRITELKISVSTRSVPPMTHRDQVGKEPWDIVAVRVLTDEGIEGNAFAWGARSGRITAQLLKEHVEPALVGEDPLDRERLWQKVRYLDRWLTFLPIYTYGPIDVALWDIAAKKARMPLVKLLGAYRDRVRAYATAAWSVPNIDSYKRQADEVLKCGFTAYKITAWGDAHQDIELCKEMRRHVGDSVDLMLDCVSAYDHRTALKVGRVCEDLGFYWLEEPLWDHDIHGYVKLCQSLDIQVLCTETLGGTVYALPEYIVRGAADIVRADVSWKGGVTSLRKTMALAEAFGMKCEVHSSCYSYTDAANLHVVCASSNCDFYEFLFPLSYYNDYGVVRPLRIENDGSVHCPGGIGMGLEIDWELLDRTKVLEL